MRESELLHKPFKEYLQRVGLPYDYSNPGRKTTNVKGQPDFSIYKNNRVLFIEFKLPSGKLSNDQIYRHNELMCAGNKIYVIYYLQDAVGITDAWRNAL